MTLAQSVDDLKTLAESLNLTDAEKGFAGMLAEQLLRHSLEITSMGAVTGLLRPPSDLTQVSAAAFAIALKSLMNAPEIVKEMHGE